MTKITFVGAGSAAFERQLQSAIVAVEPLDGDELALVDLHASATRTGGIDAPGR